MKLTKLIVVSAVAVSLVFGTASQAAEKGKGKRPERGEKGQRGGGLVKILQEIGVSKEKMQAIQKEMAALREVPQEERRSKMQEIFKKNLTEEQLKQFEAKRREMTGGKGKGGNKGKGGKGKQ
jgi:hypothetical protein